MSELINQPGPMPTRKLLAAGGTGALATVLIWTAAQFGLDLPAEVAAGIVTIAAAMAGYFARERSVS